MVDIYGRPFTRKVKPSTDADLSKYATRDEVDNLLNIAGVDPDEVAIFQDKQGKLRTSNIKWNDIIRRVLGATKDNFVAFSDGGRIKDSNISIASIKDSIDKGVDKCVKKAGDTMTGELSMSGNKITALANPESDQDASNKQYVDIVNGKLNTLRAEHDVHVGAFTRFRRNFVKTDEVVDKFFGTPPVVDVKLADVKTDINTIKQTQQDIVSGIPDIVNKTSLIKVPTGVTPGHITNIVFTVSSGFATWSRQNNTIKYTATATGVYRLSVFSAAKFEIFTTYPWRHSTDKYSGVCTVILNSGTEETFMLEAEDDSLTATSYWFCLEFVAATPQLVTA